MYGKPMQLIIKELTVAVKCKLLTITLVAVHDLK